jgi:hypothetical protein
VPTVDASAGRPGEDWIIPDIGDMQVTGCKLGMEYLAVCHDDGAVEEWINSALSIAKTPELVGILFANVFRGINIIVGDLVGDERRTRMQQLAVEAWGRDFGDGARGEQSEQRDI